MENENIGRVSASAGAALFTQRLYWLSNLSAPLPETSLLNGRVAKPDRSGVVQTHQFELPAEACERMLKIAKGSPMSIYSLLVSALTILLYRYNSNEDVLIASPPYENGENGRPAGRFLPLRFKVSTDANFKDYLLKTVRRTLLEAYANQDLPQEQIVDLIKASSPKDRISTPGVMVSLESVHGRYPADNLNGEAAFLFAAHDNTITGSIFYDEGLFSRTAVERIASHYVNILCWLLQNADARVVDAELLPEEERERLIVEYNQTARGYDIETHFAELFRLRAASCSDRIAVRDDRVELSYRKLDHLSERAASLLADFGARPDSLVVLLCDRSAEMLLLVLAAFKAGAAYLPIDPSYPQARIADILESSRAGIVVASPQYLQLAAEAISQAAPAVQPRLISTMQVLESDSALVVADRGACASNLAYVIFTSGSTGRPKGVMIEQRGMINHLMCKVDELALTSQDVVAQSASQCFDISVWQMLAALLAGGCVRVVGDEVARDPGQLLGLIQREGVTVAEVVPTLLQAMLGQVVEQPGLVDRLSSLRWLLVTGEALGVELCRRWMRAAPGPRLVNAYGPTECSDDVTHSFIGAEPEEWERQMAIGRAVGNTRLYVVDEQSRAVGVGMVGELYVGGAGVGRGYIGEGGKTAEVWVPDWYGGSGGRLYRTGDEVRWRESGELEYLGRKDQQVKVRGYRIEVGEVESLLRQQEGVEEAVVEVREKVGGEKVLVGYVVMRGGVGEVAKQLRMGLQQRLPEWMVPAVIVEMERMPVNANGKIDRRALPAPDQALLGSREYVAPRNSVEQTLANIWAGVLRLPRVGLTDNFFELGGDSILSIHIVAKAARAGLRITPKLIFQHQTIAELASVASQSLAESQAPQPDSGPVALTPILHWFTRLPLLNHNHFNQALLLETDSSLNLQLLGEAASLLLDRHDSLRLRLSCQQGAWNLHLAEPGQKALVELVDLSTASQTQQAGLMREACHQAHQSLDIASGPLMRLVAFDLGSGRPGRLLVVVHHIAVDIVSWATLLDELWLAYTQLEAGQEVELPALGTSYRQWAAGLWRYAQSQELGQEVSYWQSISQPEPLVAESSGGRNLIGSTNSIVSELSEEETVRLVTEVVKGYRAQVGEVLVISVGAALCRWSGRGSVVIEVEGHGREEVTGDEDLSRSIGWFTSIYPVEVEIGGEQWPAGVVRRMKERLREVRRGGIGYGLIKYVRESDDSLGVRQRASAEVVFNYGGQIDEVGRQGERVRMAEESAGRSKGEGEERSYKLDVSAYVKGGKLKVVWSYSEELNSREGIERLAGLQVEALRQIIEGAAQPQAEAFAPSDFPAAKVNQKDLDTLMARLKPAGGR